jgi:cell division protein FtsI (penicillin-binding protein 3)/stage V sporulation protein D (sporulation-specific penicillin-binding protein)
MLFLMEGVVEYGTGKKAKIPGYRIAGKTGTTRKSHKGDAEYIAGFAGLFPVDNPRIACYVAIDNPKGAYYAAEVAVPVFRGITHYILSYLAIPPSLPVESPVVAKEAPEPSPETAPIAPKTISTAEGLLPDFSGLTMKDVLVFLKESPLEVKFIGSGVVIDQSPDPATPLKAVKMCILIFGKPYLSQAME